jgi:hypothetical protein
VHQKRLSNIPSPGGVFTELQGRQQFPSKQWKCPVACVVHIWIWHMGTSDDSMDQIWNLMGSSYSWTPPPPPKINYKAFLFHVYTLNNILVKSCMLRQTVTFQWGGKLIKSTHRRLQYNIDVTKLVVSDKVLQYSWQVPVSNMWCTGTRRYGN